MLVMLQRKNLMDNLIIALITSGKINRCQLFLVRIVSFFINYFSIPYMINIMLVKMKVIEVQYMCMLSTLLIMCVGYGENRLQELYRNVMNENTLLITCSNNLLKRIK